MLFFILLIYTVNEDVKLSLYSPTRPMNSSNEAVFLSPSFPLPHQRRNTSRRDDSLNPVFENSHQFAMSNFRSV